MTKLTDAGISFDEQEFMALYNASGTRQGLIDALEEMRPHISAEEAELKALTDSCIEQLKVMTDDEYLSLDLDSVLDHDDGA